MIMKMYSVYDSKTEAYMQPFFMAANGAAVRAFTEIVNDKEHAFGRHPEDYSLFELATYDDATAAITPFNAPRCLGVGHEFVRTS